VEHTVKGNRVRTIRPVPVHIATASTGALSEYIDNEMELENPIVLIPQIRKYSAFVIEGFRLHIAGRVDDRILFYCAEQLMLSEDDYEYCKKIYNHIAKQKESKKQISAKEFGLTEEDNIRLYDVLREKYGGKKYKVFFGGLSDTLTEKREKFVSLALGDQSETLNEILHGFQCNPVYVNLKKIGGPGTTGVIKKSNDISKFESIKIINQSPSGLFESDTDLMKI
jgi:CRISPR-associated endonuclease Csn1